MTISLAGTVVTALPLAIVILSAVPARAEQQVLTLAEVLREIATDPKVVEAALARLGQDPAAGAFVTPERRKRLKEALKRQEGLWLERFPTLTLAQLGQAIKSSGKTSKNRPAIKEPENLSGQDLGIPTGKPPLAAPPALRDLGLGLTHGHLVHPDLKARYADNERLANVLNVLALNDPHKKHGDRTVKFGDKVIRGPQELFQALKAAKHTLVVRDVRYFANFGNLRYKGKDVATPLWIDTEMPIPGTKDTLKVPAAHTQHEFIIRGPRVKAEVCFYFGIDGLAIFRPDYALVQKWVGRRVAHEYRGKLALEAVRLAGEVRRAYAAKQARHPALAAGGYFVLGVCNDANAILEFGLTKATTLYPLTRDPAYFKGKSEVDRLARQLPLDTRKGTRPDRVRLLGSLPEVDLKRLAFPQVKADLERVLARKE